MTDMQPKKMITLDILHILQKHSDKEHRLSQHDIQELLASEYGMKVDRKTISRNITTIFNATSPLNMVVTVMKPLSQKSIMTIYF